ncbi:MAG: GNAT family N-acetyltransferase [Fusobacteriaceae bacterium]
MKLSNLELLILDLESPEGIRWTPSIIEYLKEYVSAEYPHIVDWFMCAVFAEPKNKIRMMLVVEGRNIVGMIVLDKINSTIDLLHVKSAFRRIGVGTMIFKTILKIAKKEMNYTDVKNGIKIVPKGICLDAFLRHVEHDPRNSINELGQHVFKI